MNRKRQHADRTEILVFDSQANMANMANRPLDSLTKHRDADD